MDTIRLFVGTSANNEDSEAEAVLEYTARKFCSLPLEITWMRQADKGPWSGWASNRAGRTPFSAFRWSLPAVCDFKGKALYTDVDFFFRADLAELWGQPIPRVALVRNPTGKLSTSCIVFDCEKAKAHLPTLNELKRLSDAHSHCLNHFRKHPELLAATVGDWDCAAFEKSNAIDKPRLDDPNIKAVHFTRVETQLHLKHAIPRLQKEGKRHWYTGEIFEHRRPDLQALFDQLLGEALAAGFTIDSYRHSGFAGATRRDFTYKQHIGTKVG
jgi:hypothetical protein